MNNELVTNLEIPDTISTIKPYTFLGCKSITCVKIPDSVSTISGTAFTGCTNMTEIVIPDSVTLIAGYPFSGCTSLTSITFEGTVEQWNAITKGYDWKYNVPATEVVCSDGTVSIR